jgi:NAD(P)-dependent dehydrogenase (short-subunit alcohol dehydrogenase family)
MGLHAAVELARRGLTVVATMRDVSRAGQAKGVAAESGTELDIRALDVTDYQSVRSVAEQITSDYGRIDVLINNAGRGSVATAELLTLQDVQDQLDVNYLGPVALTQAVLPAMREAGEGRILTVTSVGGAVGQPFADAYCGAKFAVEGFMQSLAVVAERFGVWVSVIEPAAVASEFVANVSRPADAGPYAELLGAYVTRTRATFAGAQTAQSAGAVIAEAATSSTYRFRWQTSDQAAAFVGASLADVDGSRVLATTRTWIS